MNPGYTIEARQTAGAGQPYPATRGYSGARSASNDGGFWRTVGDYTAVGVLAAVAVNTLINARRPRDIVDGIVLAVSASLDNDAALEDTRFNMGLFTFFAPVVAAAGVVLAIQIARKVGSLEQ